MKLLPCPMCGASHGYTLLTGSTYRWWNVQCICCGRVIDECRSNGGTHLDAELPSSWPPADQVWNEAAQYAYGLLQIATGQVKHAYQGNCPDDLQSQARDPDCPACKLLEGAT